MMVPDEIDDEVFDEEDLADGFDGELDDEDLLVEEELLGEEELSEDVEDVEAEDDDVEVLAVVGADEVEDDEIADTSVAAADDEDDLTLDQDVELALDQVLAETMRLTSEVDDDEDAVPEPEEKGELAESVLPKQDDEFRCRSCRLLKKVSQLADPDRSLCRDCV